MDVVNQGHLDDWAAEPKGQDELGLNITFVFLVKETKKEH